MYDMSMRLEDQPWYNKEPGDDEPMGVILHGNLSEGFEAIGPFKDWDEAASYADEHSLEAWIMSLHTPKDREIPFE